MSAPTIFIIDDQAAVREALGEMLTVFGYQTELHESADHFLKTYPAGKPGCAVADVKMPGMDGVEFVRQLTRRRIELPVVVISGHADVPMAVSAIKAGAEDFIEKPVNDVLLVAAINRGLARMFSQQQQQQSSQELRGRFERLTPREVEVFDLVAQGMTSQAISARLKISTRTVESYRVPMMDKMQATSIAELVRQAVRLGRLPPWGVN